MKISNKIAASLTKACLICMLVALASCGSESPLSVMTQKVILSNDFLKAPKQTNEYVVAFKTGHDYKGKWVSAKNENRYNTAYLAPALLHQAAANDFQMLGRVPLTKQVNNQNPLNTQFLYTQPSKVNKQPEEMVLVNIKFTSNQEAKTTLDQWAKADAIWFAEPNYINETFQNPYEQFFKDYQSDSGTSPAWHHTSINLFEAFGELSNATTILEPIIAVLDTGVQTDHAGLQDRVWVNNPANIGKAGCANDIHGCNTGAAFRYSFGNGDVEPKSKESKGAEFCNSGSTRSGCSHGTHVAGIVAGRHSFGSGTLRATGICPVCKILAIKAVPANGEQNISDAAIIAGLKYISNFRSKSDTSLIRVINMSLGKSVRSRAVTALIQHLFDNLNILVVAAAGNEDTNVQSYPASLPNVLAVASVQEAGDRVIKSKFSNFGTWVDIAAPGYSIPSTEASIDSAIVTRNGTSMASPIVAGVAGLVLSQEPELTAKELKERLVKTTNTSMYRDYSDNYNYYIKPAGEITRIPLLGTGLLDASRAVKNAGTTNPVSDPEVGKRVEATCGCLGTDYSTKTWLFWWFLVPLIFVCTRQKDPHPKDS